MDTTQISQLVVAMTGLITAIITLIKVLQHDSVIKDTQATVKQTDNVVQQVQASAEAAHIAAALAHNVMQTHLQSLSAAAAAFVAQQQPRPPSTGP